MIQTVIAEARKAGAKVGLCGQAPSDHPEFGEFPVACGIDSLSVTPDSFIAVKRHVAAAEAGKMKINWAPWIRCRRLNPIGPVNELTER